MQRRVGTLVITAGLLACGDDGSSDASGIVTSFTTLAETSADNGDGDGDPGDGDPGDGDGDPGDGDGDGDGVKYDVTPGALDMPGQADQCKVQDNGDAGGPCEQFAPADSFAPVLQWSFTPNDGNHQTLTTPLVANLTDDNDDGEIDLCDIPDVVLLAFPTAPNPGNLYILDGETGALHYKIPQAINWRTSPAVGDIDDDGIAEILVQSNQAAMRASPTAAASCRRRVANRRSSKPCKAVSSSLRSTTGSRYLQRTSNRSGTERTPTRRAGGRAPAAARPRCVA
jgi:hypothetical protein